MFHIPAHKATGEFSPSQLELPASAKTYVVEYRSGDQILTENVQATSRVKAGLVVARRGLEVLTVLPAGDAA